MSQSEIAIIISAFALAVSIVTFSLTFFWGGKIKYSQPSQIWMGYTNDERRNPLIYFRFYTHSTGIAGKLIGSLFLDVKRGQARQSFNVWKSNSGSGYRYIAGMKIMRDGISLENTFQPDLGDQAFKFEPGNFELKLFSKEIKAKAPKEIFSFKHEMSVGQCKKINEGQYLVFTLMADGSGYTSYFEEPSVDPNKIFINNMVEKMVSELDKIDRKESK